MHTLNKKLLLFFTLLCTMHNLFAQLRTPAENKFFRQKEDSLKRYAYEIVNGKDAAVRFRSDSNFTKIIVRALLQQNSFFYPFDSLTTISRLYAPDSMFRVFTWQVVRDDNYCRQRGFIQMKTTNGQLKLFPLRDVSEFTEADADTIANHGGWIGAVYYRIILKEKNGKKVYTLLGYDENNARTTRKYIEVLSFDEQGQPLLGMQDVFTFQNDSLPQPPKNRFVLEYKKDARARLQYDDEMNVIIYDHLISESNEPNKKYTLIPDGDYEAFEWKDGTWQHIDKLFHFKLKDGEAPVPIPLDKDGGNQLLTEPPQPNAVEKPGTKPVNKKGKP